MEKIIEVRFEFKVTIPDEQLTDMLADYKEVINEKAEIEDLFRQVAWNHVLTGNQLCEGVSNFATMEPNFTLEELDREVNVVD